MPYCNHSLPYATRVANFVASIPQDEKYGLFQNGASGIPTLGVAPCVPIVLRWHGSC